MNEDILKGRHHVDRGVTSIRTGFGHRRLVPEFAVTELVVYPTARPAERKSLLQTSVPGTIRKLKELS